MIEDIRLYLNEDPFFELEDVHLIDTATHKYVWGGCLVNKQTGIIDRYINKAKTCVGDVTYEECIFGNLASYSIRVAGMFVGYITRDFKFTAPMVSGGDYWLTGIITSYNILQEEKRKQDEIKAADDIWFNDFLRKDRD